MKVIIFKTIKKTRLLIVVWSGAVRHLLCNVEWYSGTIFLSKFHPNRLTLNEWIDFSFGSLLYIDVVSNLNCCQISTSKIPNITMHTASCYNMFRSIMDSYLLTLKKNVIHCCWYTLFIRNPIKNSEAQLSWTILF